MGYFALFTLFGILTFSAPAYSQQGESAVSHAPASAVPAPEMSSAQLAEMRADILMARKEYAAAIDEYLAILNTRRRDAALLNKIGVAYQELGGVDAAASYYKRSEKADKKLANPVNNLGTLEYGLRHYSKAVNYYKRALRLGVAQATLYSNLGYAYYSEKKFNLAMASFNKALAIDPDIFTNHGGTTGTIMQQRSASDPGMLNFFLAKSYAKAGDAERAAHFLKLARDYGYKDIQSVAKDKDFAAVIKDQRVQDVLQNRPSFDADAAKPAAN